MELQGIREGGDEAPGRRERRSKFQNSTSPHIAQQLLHSQNIQLYLREGRLTRHQLNWEDLNLGPQEHSAWETDWDASVEIWGFQRNLHIEFWDPSPLPFVQLQEAGVENYTLQAGAQMTSRGKHSPDVDTGGCLSELARLNHPMVKLSCQKDLLPHRAPKQHFVSLLRKEKKSRVTSSLWKSSSVKSRYQNK